MRISGRLDAPIINGRMRVSAIFVKTVQTIDTKLVLTFSVVGVFLLIQANILMPHNLHPCYL